MPDNYIHFDKHWPSYILYTRNSQNDKKICNAHAQHFKSKTVRKWSDLHHEKNVILQIKQADKCNIRDIYLLKG